MLTRRRECVTLIRDEPVIRSMERTGYPPWMQRGGKTDEDEQEDEDGCIQERSLDGRRCTLPVLCIGHKRREKHYLRGLYG